ncbi:alpha/beta hydrolase [Leptolyngbya sp. NK1-12]|uniref:Alpha/beta hydrolase n=1 Tax=Leptolyngbya sp. NK1-12 TaxID=2547451 RepID=A0AA96WB52_9CYAN|nr:alpha/beta hydrolase [Leptolyngbya sp. NK1-12]WNZ21799.1 alpha/beta hydrolase [Leptolyngbya sp. NK1-12]
MHFPASNSFWLPRFNQTRKLKRFGLQTLLGFVCTISLPLPGKAAETVHFSYGLFERSVAVTSLEAYAKDGTVHPDLAFFLGFLTPEVREEFRTALRTSHQLSPVVVSQSFYEPMGEKALGYVGNLIQTGKRQNGLHALRSALILAAAQPGGFTLIDVLRQFPTQDMRIDLRVALNALRQGEAFFQETNAVITGIEQLARQSESASAIEPTDIPDLRQPGGVQFSKQTLILEDKRRNRTYPVDLYLPQTSSSVPASVPVIVLSHGLGSSRADFADVAEHIASYGFAVALPEHIGSNHDLQQAVLAGRASEVFHVREFIDRPLDISFLLDQLEQRNQSEWQGRLNLEQVAAAGHSFGGYTVLVLGGATVDFAHLRQDCQQDSFIDFLNPSLLLQCRALELESSSTAVQQLTQGLQDERVSFIIAFNPVNASIFGPQGLSRVQIPVVIGASGYDPAAPIVPEQAHSFTWLTAPQKYLLLARGGAHIPQLTAMINRILSPSLDPQQLEEEITLFRSNVRALLLAFLQLYLADRTEYERYLEPFNIQTLGDPPFQFSLIRSLSTDQLTQMLEK